MVNVKILIVDDEADSCMILQNYFEDKGFQVFVAFTLNEAMDLLEAKRPDILLLDNNLPDGEGWLNLKDIVEKYPEMKINLISAYGARPELWRQWPGVKFWEKPISKKELDQLII